MKTNWKNIVVIGIVTWLTTGCAHLISVNPDVTNKELWLTSHSLIQKNVGYYIDNETLNKEIVTAGGGGDSVRYYPYRDMDNAFSKMIASVFEKIFKLENSDNDNVIRRNNINYIIKPTLVTNSSSPSLFTWPATNFIVDLNCEIRDVSGKLIDILTVVGNGQAAASEVNSDYSIAGKRAMKDALLKMQHRLREVKYEVSPAEYSPLNAQPGVADVKGEKTSSSHLSDRLQGTTQKSNTTDGYFLELAAFKSQKDAEIYLSKMRSKLGPVNKVFSIFNSSGWVRTQLGPYLSLDEANRNAEIVKFKLGYKPLIKNH